MATDVDRLLTLVRELLNDDSAPAEAVLDALVRVAGNYADGGGGVASLCARIEDAALTELRPRQAFGHLNRRAAR